MKEYKLSLVIRILGVVQGVGFRPFVNRLAQEIGIVGQVKNDGGIVNITATGDKQALESFLLRLKNECPEKASITDIISYEIPLTAFSNFSIVESDSFDKETAIIPEDLPMCESCKKELYDKKSRHYLNPFISCVSCGPRYSIINSLPYDRCRTAMIDFEMCEECKAEYSSKGIRDYSQTISCHNCGPKLILNTNENIFLAKEALEQAALILKNGGVLAIKGIGGYHFACSPFMDETLKKLRLLKNREKKPFAIMFGNIEEIKKYCTLSLEEEQLLLSPARPIVLLPFYNKFISVHVCRESRFLGAFLPYTPLQQLLLDICGPLVMTSANISDEPIIKDDAAILAIKSNYLDGVLYNTRKIEVPLDDSVARIVNGKQQLIRRSRGFVPLPINIDGDLTHRAIFAAGADLKAAFCLFKNAKAYMSQYFGDMESLNVYDVYKNNYYHMTSLFKIIPEYASCDMHPDYFSSRFTNAFGLKIIPVQHHHAHIASVMAEHHLKEKVIGVAFDGSGYGDDGAIWGGEFLVCKGASYQRAAHLSYVPICGGDNASKDALLCAMCYLLAVGREDLIKDIRLETVKVAIAKNISIQKYSSMGRLFDAVSAILNIKTYNSYEGECAIALENLAFKSQADGIEPYHLDFEVIEIDETYEINQLSIINQIIKGMENNADKGALALGFHKAISKIVLSICQNLREKSFLNAVVLSGGVFANMLLLEDCINSLTNDGFRVYFNQTVPMNDGGIALGQAFIAAQKIKEEEV